MRNKLAVVGHDECHDAESGSARGYHFVTVIVSHIAAFAGKPTGRVTKVPEITESLALNHIEQYAVGKAFDDTYRLYAGLCFSLILAEA